MKRSENGREKNLRKKKRKENITQNKTVVTNQKRYGEINVCTHTCLHVRARTCLFMFGPKDFILRRKVKTVKPHNDTVQLSVYLFADLVFVFVFSVFVCFCVIFAWSVHFV